MPCDTIAREERERLEREAQIKALEQSLKDKSAKLVLQGNTLSISGWSNRGDWCDECAIRRLKLTGSLEVRREISLMQHKPGIHQLSYGHTHADGTHHSHN
jgi:hypothetical protein